MRRLVAWLGVAALSVICAPRLATAAEPLKPYVVLALDTSGSMDEVTGSGAPSCGGADTKHNHARCAIQRIVNSYGDMVFALGRFRMAMSGTTSGTTFPAGCATSQAECSADDDRFELLTPLVDGSNQYAAKWVDYTGNTCVAPTTFPFTDDPEVWNATGQTPLEGTLRGARRYYQGRQALDGTVIWPGTLLGFSPINTDPLKSSFLAKPSANAATCNSDPTTCNAAVNCTGTNCCCAEQCRPYIVILLTDGEETCSGTPANAATSLLSTPFPINNDGSVQAGYKNYRIETKPIGFGQATSTFVTQIEGIAHAGGAADLPGACTTGTEAGCDGYYAGNEAGLQLAITNILADAIKTETCNNLDDDCDTNIDEDFPGKAASCTNNLLGKCRVNGTNVCRTDGTGLACNSGQTACNGLSAGNACNVQNASGQTVTGACTASPSGLLCVPTADPTEPQICNNIDDDCDGRVDEGVTGCTCVVTGESCDGVDQNCNGIIDEGLTRPCGTGTCQGTQSCVVGGTGTWTTCTAPVATAEICDGLDNDCDGNADGFNQACSNMSTGFPALDPRNNPGGMHSPMSACEMLGVACVCHPGNRTCTLNGGGTFGACVGEVTPGIEVCNNLDDDCDGLIDETTASACTTSADCPPITPTCDNNTCQPADCSINSCGGILACVNGVQMCTQTAGVDNNCNGVDEDCDGSVDEGYTCTDPNGADNILGNADDCPCTISGQCGAHESCQNGAVICMGDPVGQESCNCDDDDCDGTVDEGSLCGAGATCTNCQCAFACSPGEFPCPMGKACVGGFCIADPCFGVTCPNVNGNKQVCRPDPNNVADHQCLSACDPAVITCASPNICFGPSGECKPDDCTTFPDRCTANQNCIAGTCVTNLCQGVNCPTDQYCVAGQCYGSCADITCPTGERCRLGACVADPCGKPCPSGQVCHDETGECVANPCSFVTCPQGQYCNPNNNGMCEDDLCVGTSCPNAGEVCRGGTCYDPADFLPDAGVETYVTTGGGGGCATNGDASGGLLLGLAAVLLMRRRRAQGGVS